MTPLEKLATLFGLGSDIDKFELTDRWSFNGEIAAADLRASMGEFERLVPDLYQAYGDALSLTLDTDVREFALDSPAPRFDDLRSAVEDESPLTLDIKLDKIKLAGRRDLIDAAVATRLFLYQKALTRTLAVPLTKLDDELFEGVAPRQKLIIFLESHDIRLDGEFLAVIGGSLIPGWRSAIIAPPELPMLERARSKLSWSSFALIRLTPVHLQVKRTHAEEGDLVAAALDAQLFVCSLAYLAQRSEWHQRDASWTFTFASDRLQTAVEISQAPTQAFKYPGSARMLAQIARWTYEVEHDVDDRLAVVQYTIVDALKDNSAVANAAEILRLAPELEKRTRWGWEAFVAGELKKFIDQVKALEDAVAATAKDYDEQVSALTKSLTDNMLAAVAFVVGSFIAAIMKTPFEEYAFVVGTSVFALYLGLVPMRLGLRATKERFDNTKANFERRRHSFAQRLRDEPVSEIVRPILERSEPTFLGWYERTRTIYTIVLVLLVASIVGVPLATHCFSTSPDEFSLTAATVNQPVRGAVTIRGEHFDRKKDIVVVLGRTIFTNTVDPATLKVYGTTALIFTPPAIDLAAREATVRQGTAGPKKILMR